MAAARQFSQRDTPMAGSVSPRVIRTGHSVPRRSAHLVDLAIPNREMARPNLTPRECDVLLCWLTSDSKTVVSAELGLSSGTVKTHLHRIRSKYEAVGRNASTKAALVARALQDGLIRLEDL